MNYKKQFIGLLFLSFCFFIFDFLINGYSKYLIIDSSNKNQEGFVVSESFSSTEELKSMIPQEFKDKLSDNLIINEPVFSSVLFNRLIISNLGIKESMQTSLYKGSEKYGVIYEISGDANIYFQLRDALNLVLEKGDDIFDANNLGDYSFYYNDARRDDIIFRLALIDNRVWGFEYPRVLHNEYQELVKIIAQ